MKAPRFTVALSVFVLFAVSGIALAQPFPGMPLPGGQPGMDQPQPGMMPGMGPGPGMMMPGQMPGAGGGTAIAVTNDFVFVVYNGALYQFTVDGLNLIKSVPLRPQGQRMRPQGGPDGGAGGPAGGQNRQQRQQRQQQKPVNPENGNIQPEMN